MRVSFTIIGPRGQLLVIHQSRMKIMVRNCSRTRHHISLLLARARSMLLVGPRVRVTSPANSMPNVARPEAITQMKKIVLAVCIPYLNPPSSRPEREARSGEPFFPRSAAYCRKKVSPRGPEPAPRASEGDLGR